MIDENTFFRKATLLICSSLDIEMALARCREFLAQHLPADEMTLNIYDPDAGGLRYLARANRAGGKKLELILKLPQKLRTAIESGERLRDFLIINRPEEDPVGKIIAPALGFQGGSFIALRLRIEGQRLGVVDLFSNQRDRFTEEHARLFKFLREPFAIAMANALKHQEMVNLKEQLASDNRYLSQELLSYSGDEIIGENQGLKYVMLMVKQVAPLNNTVLLLGETGVGKEVIANAIHLSSTRGEGPFIKVNCGAIPESLIDSELFGHEKGAFTGAVKRKRGLFERADMGTLFLDEIGELPPSAQVRLLRVLQTHEIERVGGSPPIPLDIRVIAATHRNLENMVGAGDFREDLWFRINVFPIPIPPLRQRKEDVPDLVRYLVGKKSRELGLRKPPYISQGIISPLQGYDWPGNVRDLENVVERALIQHRGGPLVISRFARQSETLHKPEGVEGEPRPLILNELIATHIQEVLEMAGGKVNGQNGAAELLGVNPNTLRNRMKKLGIIYGRRYRQMNT